MSEYLLIDRLLAQSVNETWAVAVEEWKVVDSYRSEKGEECLCGKKDIRELNTIRNMLNENEEIVGSCCVKKFIPAELGVVDGLKRITRDLGKSAGQEMIDFALQNGWIYAKDHIFYSDTIKKRNLSDAQLNWREDINIRIIAGYKRLGLGRS